MTAHNSPFLALHQQRDGVRQKHFSVSRPRAAGQHLGAFSAAHGVAPDCVFKRFPAIGDIAAIDKQHA